MGTLWPQIGATGLLSLVVVMIMTGRLVPRRTLKDIEEQRARWEAAWSTSQDTITQYAEQVTALVEVGRTTEALLRSLVDRDRTG
jgi:hypothetical protein